MHATPRPAKAHKTFPQAMPQKSENFTSPIPRSALKTNRVIRKTAKIAMQEIRAGTKASKQKNAAASPITRVPK